MLAQGSDGVPIALGMLAMVAVITGIYAWVTNRSSWLQLSSRAAAKWLTGAGVVMFLAAGVLMPEAAMDEDDPPTASSSESATPEASSPDDVASSSPSEDSSESPKESSSPEEATEPEEAEESEEQEESEDPSEDEESPEPEETEEVSEPESGTVLEQLEAIEVKPHAQRDDYDRKAQFGDGWKDPDRNGCDARNDILNRDLSDTTYREGTHGCIVTSGVLDDPYTEVSIDFVRGQDTSTAVQIDHVVALSDAWQKGAPELSEDQRVELANDPLNLFAVDGPTNAAKGDLDAASWLPPSDSFHCEYVAAQTAVKSKYGLWMTQAEHDAIYNIVSTSCPNQQAPASDGGVVDPVEPTASAEAPEQSEGSEGQESQDDSGQSSGSEQSEQSGSADSGPSEESGGEVTYQNCTEVRDAGADPISEGDPGWDTKFDRDGDGVGCE